LRTKAHRMLDLHSYAFDVEALYVYNRRVLGSCQCTVIIW